MSSSSDDITIVQDILNGHGPDGGCANGFDSDFYPDHGWLMDDDSSSQLKIKTNSTPYEHPPLPTGPSLIDDNPFGRGCGVVFAINCDQDKNSNCGSLVDGVSSSSHQVRPFPTPSTNCALPLLRIPDLNDYSSGRGAGGVFANNYDQDKNSNRGSLVDGVSSSSHLMKTFRTPSTSTNCAVPLFRLPDLRDDHPSGRGSGGGYANGYDQDKNSDHGSLVDADSSSQFQIKPTPYEHPIPLPTGPLLKDDRATGCGPGCFCANCGGPGFSGQDFNPDRRYGSSSSQKRPYPTPYNHSTPQDLSIRPSVRENYPSLERRRQDENKPEVLNKKLQVNMPESLERRRQDENKPEVLNKKLQVNMPESLERRRQDENKPEVLNKKLQVNMPESGRGAGGVFANNYDQDKNSNRGSFVDGVSSSSHLMKPIPTPSTSTNCAVPLFRLPDLRDDYPSRSEGAEENGWDCSVCTYRNTAEALKCLVCDACRATLTREENEKERIEKDLKKNIVKLLKFYPKEKVLEKVNSIINEERNSTFPTKTPLSPNTRKKSEGKPKKLKSENLEIWDAEFEKKDDYHTLLALNDVKLVSNVEKFECPVCFLDVEVGEGATLQECLHSFCKECLAGAVQFSETVVVKCPFRNDEYSCEFHLQEREVKALVTPEAYERHLQRSMALAESQAQDSFHCKTPDCRGWCLFEDNVNTFFCPVCRHTNCLTCGAIHEGINCRQYQEDVAFKCDTSEEARKTRAHLQSMVDNGEAMRCPQCRVFVMRKWGCDWLKCSMCHTEICWVTKGPRWGPGGSGDTSGGCKCRVNGRKCHRKCSNCH